MTERNPPVWMQTGSYEAKDDRIVTGLLSTRGSTASGTSTGILGGVVPPFDQLNAVATGSSMVVTLSSGILLMPSIGVNPPGAYICYNDGGKTLTHDVEASGNPRIDVIYAKVSDSVSDIDQGLARWDILIKKGSPSASPVNPSLAVGEFPLWSVRIIPASLNGGTNKISSTQLTDLRLFNVAQGGTWVVRNQSAAPPMAPGRMLYNTDSNHLYVSDGTSWDYFLTYQEWSKVFAALRPKHASNAANIRASTAATSKGVWSNPMVNLSGGTTNGPSVVTRSPSGMFKVDISAYGRVTAATNSAHVSIRVLNGANAVFTPDAGWRSIGFYNLNWEHHGTSFLVSGVAADTDLTFRVEYMRTGSGSGVAYFSNAYLMVEPVL